MPHSFFQRFYALDVQKLTCFPKPVLACLALQQLCLEALALCFQVPSPPTHKETWTQTAASGLKVKHEKRFEIRELRVQRIIVNAF